MALTVPPERPSKLRAVTDFPDPDSPTNAKQRPGTTVKEMFFTAAVVPKLTENP